MITIYSSYDFQVLLRELYEKIYEIICDSGHEFWKNKIIKKSITHNKVIVSNNYWCNLIFKIYELKCNEEDRNITINKYNLTVKSKIEKKNKKKNKKFQ